MKRLKYLLVIFILIALAKPKPAYGAQEVADNTATLNTYVNELKVDNRAIKLKAFLKSYNSPASDYSDVFISEADKYHMDYRWIPMIMGAESTFGINIPTGSYNGWGWGIPTGSKSGIGFSSWEDGIATVTKGIANNYIAKGLNTLEKIGTRYAASPHWSTSVNNWIDKYEAFEIRDTENLAINF